MFIKSQLYSILVLSGLKTTHCLSVHGTSGDYTTLMQCSHESC